MLPAILVTKFAIINVCDTLCSSNGTALPPTAAGMSEVKTAIALLFAIIGAVALIFVILGGISYVTSQGDPQAAAKARRTIIYALVGVAVALSAEAIINFVIGQV